MDTDSEIECYTETNANWPRFLVMELLSDDLFFAIQKRFKAIARTLKSIKKLRDGTFLV